MSREEFSDDCLGCRPVIIDPKTMKPMDKMTPLLERAWKATTREQREAFHRVCCLNSRDSRDVDLARQIAVAIENELKKGKDNDESKEEV